MLPILFVATSALRSQDQAPPTITELVPSVTSVVAGKSFFVALHMRMAPGWHSYYSNPGESGMATSIKWHLPAGFKAGPILWQPPHRIMVRGVAGYVYEGDAWLVTRIEPPKSLKGGDDIAIRAHASWLLCHEACVPQDSDLALLIPVSSPDAPIQSNRKFDAALVRFPKPNFDRSVRARLSGKSVTLFVPYGELYKDLIKFFPSDPTYFGADRLTMRPENLGVTISIPLSRYAPKAPSRLVGILGVPALALPHYYWIDVPIQHGSEARATKNSNAPAKTLSNSGSNSPVRL